MAWTTIEYTVSVVVELPEEDKEYDSDRIVRLIDERLIGIEQDLKRKVHYTAEVNLKTKKI